MNTFLNNAQNIPAKEQVSGVDIRGFYPLKFSQHLWNSESHVTSNTITKDGTEVCLFSYPADELISLVNIVVKVDSDNCYYISNPLYYGRQVYANKNAAYDFLINYKINQPYLSIKDHSIQYTVDEQKIELAIFGKKKDVVGPPDNRYVVDKRAGTIPSVYSTVRYPMQDELICDSKGEFFLNLDAMYETLNPAYDFEKSSCVLRMIYRALCNYPALLNADGSEMNDEEERAALFEKVLTNTYTAEEKDFKFVVNFLAAIVQRPGINLMTNMWFCGEYQGIGKGTLIAFLRSILGEDKVGDCKANMILGNFNAEMDGKFVISINEKQAGVTPEIMTTFLKQYSVETNINVEKKGQDPVKRINTINYIGSMNNAGDVFKIEEDDRRNVIFRTVQENTDPDKYWRNYAKMIAENAKKDLLWAKSFAWVLLRVDYDEQLLSTSYQTRGYAELHTSQVEETNPLYHWAVEEFPKFSGQKLTAKELREMFKEEYNRDYNQTIFNKHLLNLAGVKSIPVFYTTKPQNVLTLTFDGTPPVKENYSEKAQQFLDRINSSKSLH